MSLQHQATWGGASVGQIKFQIAGGSVPGRTHVLSGKNNQDAFAWRACSTRCVAVVTDGCSSGAFTEVGARLGAELLTARLFARVTPDADADATGAIGDAVDDVVTELVRLADVLGGARPVRVESTLLFTVVGVVLLPTGGWFFSVGDGVTGINGAVRSLGPFANNAPPYLGYRLLGAQIPVKVEPFSLYGCRNVLIGTDGAQEVPELGALCGDDKVFTNADMLRRRLTVLSRSTGRLHDDTTLVAIRPNFSVEA